LPSTAKPRKSASSRAASSRNGNSAATKARRTRSASPKSRASNGHGISEQVGDKVGSIGSRVDSIAEKARNGAGTVVKGAAAATVGTAVAAVAGRAVISSRRRKRVLGVPMPRRRTSMKSVAKQFSGLAGELEKKSLNVSKASGRAKEAAKILT
jgi:hypothetical protein